ncbi:MAG: hypothetical protein H6670_08310 [Anaerolineaceae bacterium]|nr:hypothetical protein [Anaerolineaceae bacterium]
MLNFVANSLFHSASKTFRYVEIVEYVQNLLVYSFYSYTSLTTLLIPAMV